jgi:phosphoribosylamine--glycine ligase
VLASGGYPDAYNKGDVISGLESNTLTERKVFHAGTRMHGDDVVTNGGRVLCATALGDTVTQAQKSAYCLIQELDWNNVYFRHDIGYRAIARENDKHAT